MLKYGITIGKLILRVEKMTLFAMIVFIENIDYIYSPIKTLR